MRKEVVLACSVAVPVMAHYGFGAGAIFRLWMTLGGLDAIASAAVSMIVRRAGIAGHDELPGLGPGAESLPWLNDIIAEIYHGCAREFCSSGEGKRLVNGVIADRFAAPGWKWGMLRRFLNPRFRWLDLGELSPVEVWAIKAFPSDLVEIDAALDVGITLRARDADVELALNRFVAVAMRQVSVRVALRVSPSLIFKGEDNGEEGETEDEEETADPTPPFQYEHVEVTLLQRPVVEYDIATRICGCSFGFLNFLRPVIVKFLINPAAGLILFPKRVVVGKVQAKPVWMPSASFVSHMVVTAAKKDN